MNKSAVFTVNFSRTVGDGDPMILAHAGDPLTVIGPSNLSPDLWEIQLRDGTRHDASKEEFKLV